MSSKEKLFLISFCAPNAPDWSGGLSAGGETGDESTTPVCSREGDNVIAAFLLRFCFSLTSVTWFSNPNIMKLFSGSKAKWGMTKNEVTCLFQVMSVRECVCARSQRSPAEIWNSQAFTHYGTRMPLSVHPCIQLVPPTRRSKIHEQWLAHFLPHTRTARARDSSGNCNQKMELHFHSLYHFPCESGYANNNREAEWNCVTHTLSH